MAKQVKISLTQFTEKDGREGWWVQLYIGGRRDNGGGVYGGFSKGVSMAKAMLKFHNKDWRERSRSVTSNHETKPENKGPHNG